MIFAVWGPNVSCDDLGSPIRCSFAAPPGVTGLQVGAGDESEGAEGDKFLEALVVNPGDGFFLMVDNWSASASGFNLRWTGSALASLDCSADPPCSIVVDAGPSIETCKGNTINLSGSGEPPISIIFYQWTADPPIASTYILNPNSSNTLANIPDDAPSSITFTLTANGFNNCNNSDDVVLTITEGASPNLQPINDLCDTADPVSLSSTQDGITGTWSGDGVNADIFDPSGLSGMIDLTFTPDPGQCASVATVNINVFYKCGSYFNASSSNVLTR